MLYRRWDILEDTLRTQMKMKRKRRWEGWIKCRLDPQAIEFLSESWVEKEYMLCFRKLMR
jgi:hypothetical protein